MSSKSLAWKQHQQQAGVCEENVRTIVECCYKMHNITQTHIKSTNEACVSKHHRFICNSKNSTRLTCCPLPSYHLSTICWFHVLPSYLYALTVTNNTKTLQRPLSSLIYSTKTTSSFAYIVQFNSCRRKTSGSFL